MQPHSHFRGLAKADALACRELSGTDRLNGEFVKSWGNLENGTIFMSNWEEGGTWLIFEKNNLEKNKVRNRQ